MKWFLKYSYGKVNEIMSIKNKWTDCVLKREENNIPPYLILFLKGESFLPNFYKTIDRSTFENLKVAYEK